MNIELDDLQVVNNKDARRFEMQIGDALALVDYLFARKTMIFTHTEVPEAFEGRGIASKMVQNALDEARDKGLKIIPLCPFVASYVRRHPEYHSLVWVFRYKE